MQVSTIKAIINMFHATSDDSTRYGLTFVRLTAKDGAFVLKATDGHMLSTVRVADEVRAYIAAVAAKEEAKHKASA